LGNRSFGSPNTGCNWMRSGTEESISLLPLTPLHTLVEEDSEDSDSSSERSESRERSDSRERDHWRTSPRSCNVPVNRPDAQSIVQKSKLPSEAPLLNSGSISKVRGVVRQRSAPLPARRRASATASAAKCPALKVTTCTMPKPSLPPAVAMSLSVPPRRASATAVVPVVPAKLADATQRDSCANDTWQAPAAPSRPPLTRGSVTVVPMGPEGKTLRGGGGRRANSSIVEESGCSDHGPECFDMSSSPEKSKSAMGSPENTCFGADGLQTISVEYDALDASGDVLRELQACAPVSGDAAHEPKTPRSPHVVRGFGSPTPRDSSCHIVDENQDAAFVPEAMADEEVLSDLSELPDECW